MPLAEPAGPLWTAVKALYDSWPPDSEDVAQQLQDGWRRADVTMTQAGGQLGQVGGVLPGTWQDGAGTVLHGRVNAHVQQVSGLSEGMRHQSVLADRYASTLRATKQTIAQSVESTSPLYAALGSPQLGVAGLAMQQIVAARLAEQLKVMVLGEAAALSTGQTQGTTLPADATPPPAGGTPAQNAAWWKSLSDPQKAALLRDHPEWLGNLDGLPGSVRSQANVARVPGERSALRKQRDTLQAQLDQAKTQVNPYASEEDLLNAAAVGRVNDLTHQVAGVDAKLQSLDAIDAVMAKGDHQLLTLDTSGLRVKAAVSAGNVDTADNVAVFTPGLTTTVNGDLVSYDGQLQSLRQRAEGLGGGKSVAAVTWIGYEAPQLNEVFDPSHSVALDQDAKAGGAALNGFLNGIGAARDISGTPVHLTALAHSYGSLTTGAALHQPTPVDDFAAFGSPGLDIKGGQELLVPPGHSYNEWANGDPVPFANGVTDFGAPPASDPSFKQLFTGDGVGVDGQALHRSFGHSDYLTPGSTSQYNLAAIVAGKPELTSLDRLIPPQAPPLPGAPQPLPQRSPLDHPIVPPPPTASAPPGAVPQPPPAPGH
ncbi:alpha/beta hydrolase [Amycolatopsis sp. H20-H5]|uniref:alpha/beta hydrolase n=1 Tax=Amycolatopsis sp. H20-H5 TaxID=3046309 RepID=UPI002DBA31E5|nr:alpha/beta hydrolase [Amycolatopsis sp. H20-H5]MEC3975605.1 alpha/beta hydrolase [Amycolatopsis sp. H20-H5]